MNQGYEEFVEEMLSKFGNKSLQYQESLDAFDQTESIEETLRREAGSLGFIQQGVR